MRNILFLTLFLANAAWAINPPVYPMVSGCIDASVNNIPTQYSLTTRGSSLVAIPFGMSASHFAVTKNTVSAELAFSLTSNSSITPPSNLSANQLIIDSGLLPAIDGLLVSNVIMVRSNSGSSLGTGKVCVAAW